ncbi:hypothetical protein [Streptomyces sp. NPDC001508]|uniref:hypothetical protein n=1 Tax=Streptomyces sp. NPDC001508 TaxID=3154656 RepID=UPI00331ED1B6
MITDESIGRLLQDCGLLTADTWDDDTPFVLDSLTLVWLVHLLEEQHGITVDFEDEQNALGSCTSVRDLRRFLADRAGERTTPPEILHGS